MRKEKQILFVIGLLIGLTAVSSAAPKVTVSQILKSLDTLQKIKEDISVRVELVQQDREQGTKLLEALYYARDMQDLFLIVMTRPESEKGNGYLKIDKNFWMYRRNTRTFQHINRNENIAGTDTDAQDLEASKYDENYRGVIDPKTGQEQIISTTLGNIPVYQIEIIAKVPDVDYPKKILFVRQDNFLPLKELSYSLSGTLMYTHLFLQYTQINGRYIAVKELVIDEFEKGNKTLWEIKGISLGKLDDTIFTKAYLENLSK